MPNRYATLVGSNKISAEYTKITAGFDGVQADMDGKAPASVVTDLASHTGNATIHVTAGDKTSWNSKAPGNTRTDLDNHIANGVVHVTQADHDKLDGIEDGAEVNQNAYATINGVAADKPLDGFTIKAGIGITVTTNPLNKEATITATGEATPGAHGTSHTEFGSDPIPNATETEGGLMSAADKTKLDGMDGDFEDLAGAGRTTETVKGNADAIAAVASDVVDLGDELAAQKADFESLYSANAVNLFVDPVNGVDTNDGSIDYPVKTATKAISLAPALVRGRYEGVFINLAPGTYTDSVDLIGYPLSLGTRIWFKGAVDGGGNPTVIFDCENTRSYAFQVLMGVRVLLQDISIINIKASGYGVNVSQFCEAYLWNVKVRPSSGATGVTGISIKSNCSVFTRKIDVANCTYGLSCGNSSVVTTGYGGDTDYFSNCTESGIYFYECTTGHIDRVEIDGCQYGIRLTHSARANIGTNTIESCTYGIAAQYNAIAYISTGNVLSGNTRDYVLSSGGVRVDADASAANPVDRYTALPTASDKYRGCVVFVAGSTGQPDKTYTCQKDSANNYVWVETVRANRPAARAYKSTNQSITASTYTKIAFDTKTYDSVSNYDTSLSRFVAPDSGYYSISVALQWASQSVGNRLILKFYKNGGESNILYDSAASAALPMATVGTASLFLAKNDYVEVYAYSVGATSILSGAAATYFEVLKIGE